MPIELLCLKENKQVFSINSDKTYIFNRFIVFYDTIFEISYI